MAEAVVFAAELLCTQALGGHALMVEPVPRVTCEGRPIATIMDFKPFVNILPNPGTLCRSPTNPEVVAATAAAAGVFTPMPCTPVTTPWEPGAVTVLAGGIPVLDNMSHCECPFGAGVISIVMPGAVRTIVP